MNQIREASTVSLFAMRNRRVYNMDPEPRAEYKLPEQPSLHYEKWVSELRSCIKSLQELEFDKVDKSLVLKELTDCWLDNYFEFNVEDHGYSRTDFLFYVRCFVLLCHRGRLEKQGLEAMHELYNRVALLSCNHNCNSKMPFPSAKELEELETDCFSFIAQHYLSDSQLQQTIKQFRENPKTEVKPLSEEMRMLKQQLFIEDEKNPNANKGYLFTQEPLRMILTFIPLCSRVFSCIQREQRLFQQYPLIKLEAAEPEWILRLHKWLAEECSIDAEDDLKPKFIELVHELQIPLGGRLQAQRRLVTRDDHANAATILEKELGYDTAMRLTEGVNTIKPSEVANNCKHEHFAPLVLVMFDLRLSQLKKTPFLKNFVVLPTALPIVKDLPKPKRFDTLLVNGQPRAPLLTLLQRKWMIHYGLKFYECASIEEALLGWLRVLIADFNSEVPCSAGVSLSDFQQRFFS